jgi:hypothetical protein
VGEEQPRISSTRLPYSIPNVYELSRYRLANERVLCSFGASGSEHAKLVYDDATILLAMAIADNVLVGIRPETDLQELENPPGENKFPLLYTTGAGKKKFILRKCSVMLRIGRVSVAIRKLRILVHSYVSYSSARQDQPNGTG